MSSRSQKRANKQNAQHSTGPRTDEGKQRSSQNALKHGLRSKHPIMPGEDPAEYQQKLDKLRADLRPLNALEEDLVEQIADTSWRLKRLSRIEAAVNAYHLDRSASKEHNAGKDEHHILGDTFTGYALTDLQRLSRYEAQLSRRYHRAVKELRDLRKGAEEYCFVERQLDHSTPADHDHQQYQEQEQETNQQNNQPIEPTQSTQPPMKPTTSDTSASPTLTPNRDRYQEGSQSSGHPGPKDAIK